MTSRQVEANAKYRQKIFDQYFEHGASAKVAAQRAEKAALKYASKQHRYRAETIVHTELAFAYNQGAHIGVLQAINAGFMGRCAMVWTTAGTNRVCPRCLALKGSIVGHTNESGVTLPPIHPRCRCTIEYREVEPPKPANNSAVDSLTAPPSRGNLSVLTLPPQLTSSCKNFDELKLYWAESYNVKIADEVAALDFVSVNEAMQGVEAVLNEFPPAGRFLKEIDVMKNGIMCTSHGYSRINFNPKYFSDRRKLMAELKSGEQINFYPKNMTPFSAGAHEAGHIVVRYLTEKSGAPDSDNIIFANEMIQKAYVEAIKSFRTIEKFKSLRNLRKEICDHALNYGASECLADAVADYKTNGEQAELLSRKVWQILKKEAY